MKRSTIEYHLKSAVDGLVPDVLDRIDLKTPQDPAPLWQDENDRGKVVSFGKRFRAWGAAAAACLCIVLAGNGGYNLYLNQVTDSVIGIDVNPSVELSINRKNQVLEVTPLNEDARIIMEEMDLEGVDLNVAVNAVIGAFVTHGYLDDLDNAILVTVTNDSVSKANVLRQEVVEDIEESLKENEVQAVVYDQQVVENDEVKELSEEYGISYGKAYFLQELINQNSSLSMDDMEELAGLTMEEIAARITESSYALGERTEIQETPAPETSETPETSSEEESSSEESSPEETTTEAQTTTEAPATEPETAVEEEAENRLKIDFVDYNNGILSVYFTTSVKWKDETVSIRGENDESYAAMIEETYSDSCEIRVSGLEGGKTYRFSIGGVRQRQDGKPMSVSGTFEVPVISEEATEEETETAAETTEPETETEASAEETEESSSAADTSQEETEPATEPETETSAPEESSSQEPESTQEESTAAETENTEPETETSAPDIPESTKDQAEEQDGAGYSAHIEEAEETAQDAAPEETQEQ